MAAPENANEKPKTRIVENWELGETLGKGAYGVVKIGYHVRTKKPYALKFMTKDKSWNTEDHRRVMIEINSLRTIRHANVMRLKAFNLACMYPRTDGSTEESVLLVMELCTGGEIFDILFYTQSLSELIARTYFKQLMDGLEAIHAAGVTHRDLKPQNLLLDHNYNLKITDFGLSSIFEGENEDENIMATTCVGTRGYQAPEIVLQRRYTPRCDVFSCGVVLFIFLTGYPPFEQAHATDTWYKPIAAKKPAKFWKKHKRCGITNPQAKSIIVDCLTYQPQERKTVEEIMAHEWLTEPILEGEELKSVMKQKHAESVEKRRNDVAKQERLADSVRTREINLLDYDLTLQPPECHAYLNPVHTFEIIPEVHPYEVLAEIERTMKEKFPTDNSPVNFNSETFELTGNFRYESGDPLTLNAKAVRVDGANYLTMNLVCELIQQRNELFTEVFAEVVEMLGDAYETPEIIYDDDDEFDEQMDKIMEEFNLNNPPQEALLEEIDVPVLEDVIDVPAEAVET